MMPVIVAILNVLTAVLPIVAAVLAIVIAVVARCEAILEIVAALLRRAIRKLARPLANAAWSIADAGPIIAQTWESRSADRARQSTAAGCRGQTATGPICGKLTSSRTLTDSARTTTRAGTAANPWTRAAGTTGPRRWHLANAATRTGPIAAADPRAGATW
jgi:hypothetical protein